MKAILHPAIILLLLTASNLGAATHYVSQGSTNPRPPYTNWVTAATKIQDAVNAAATNGVVWVTNGVYSGGVSVTNPLTVLSVNGPQFTIIDAGGSNRCVSMSDGASLTGFTVTNGDAADNDGGGVWCASTNAFVTNCVIVDNRAEFGGGAYGGSLYDCTLTNNHAIWRTVPGYYGWGGGANSCVLHTCVLTGNSAIDEGGGADSCTLYNCVLTGNSTFNNNGGAGQSTLYNCALTGNSARFHGGGAGQSTLYDCTLTGNSADQGGGADSCTLRNCIVYFNTASGGVNYDPSSSLDYCCTAPLPTDGVGNITVDPQLASAFHLSAGSHCRAAGGAAYATGTDIDGETWGDPPSIGCDEYHAGSVTGPLTVNPLANYTNVTAGYPVALTGLIEGRTTDSAWEFGDGDLVINQPYVTHTWTEPGEYVVALWAFNEGNPGGVSARVTIQVVAQPVVYVSPTSTNPQPPYISWATAATSIRDAAEAPLPGHLVVVVTNGVYPGDLFVGNRVVLVSVNGPRFTVIDGAGTNQCVWLADGAGLSGFTLTNGQGGVSCNSRNAFVTNCVLAGNAYNGASGGTLYNCALIGNARGAAFNCTLYNCTVTANSTSFRSGGANASTLYNCIVEGNRPSNYDSASTLNYCCTAPLPTHGVGNLTNASLFLDYTIGNLRLQSNSPCINAGNNAYVTAATDLDGNPRMVSGTVDVGAYEYQGAGSRISYAWLLQYGLPKDGSEDYADPDHDGMSNWQEWVCGTNPTNAFSVLRMVSVRPTRADAMVTWQSVAGINYVLERSKDLKPPFTLLTTNIVGQAGTTSYADTNAAGAELLFYRVGVQAP